MTHHQLQQAIRHHQANELPQAEQLYRAILQTEPNHPDANHNLGVIAVTVNKPELALSFFKLALETNPNQAQFWLSYIDALIKAEQSDLARELLEKGLKFGLTGEKIEELAMYLKKSEQIKTKPIQKDELSRTEMEALVLLFNEGNFAEVEKVAIELTMRFEGHYFGWKMLGAVLLKQGKIAESIESCKKSIALSPNDIDAHHNLSVAFRNMGDLENAKKHCQLILTLRPNFLGAINNLANIFKAEGQLHEAEKHYLRVLETNPDYVDAHNNLAGLLQQLGRLDEAELHFQKSLKLKPDDGIGHYNFSLLLMLKGELEKGWAEYLWFYHPNVVHPSKPPQPKNTKCQWCGESLQGKTILIYSEQGFGDMIQFVRYAELLKRCGATVWILARASLIEIFKTVPWIDCVVTNDDCQFDFWVFPLQLPHYFKTALATIPCSVPYLLADETKSTWWNEWLNQKIPTTNKRVGLVWAGNPTSPLDANRSISFSNLSIFAGLENITFISLQLGEKAQNDLAKGVDGLTILDASPFIHNFADSAALLKNLDVLITVCSAPAHLAGALNLPVWTLISKPFDWRWLLERTDSPWYPSMRLFRQPEIGDWASVLNDVKTALKNELLTSKNVAIEETVL